MKISSPKITVLGAGSWGTTIAILLFKKGYAVTLWELFSENVKEINEKGENAKFLPGISIPKEIFITDQLEDAVKRRDVILIVIPSHTVRNVVRSLKNTIEESTVIISLAKGIEEKRCLRMSEVIVDVLGERWKNNVGVLSGPSHAEEVSRNIPTAVVASAYKENICRFIQELFVTENLRVYTNYDIIGVELGGALKNIVAISTGISDGLGFGDNTKAALITRGLAEITRLGVKMGAESNTFFGLTGLGDLIVTCTSRHSRNRYVGEAIGRGKSLAQVLNEMVMIAEGVRTTRAVYDWAKKMLVELPIINEVYAILFENKDPYRAVSSLMRRETKPEW